MTCGIGIYELDRFSFLGLDMGIMSTCIDMHASETSNTLEIRSSCSRCVYLYV